LSRKPIGKSSRAVELLAECYANRCFAERLADIVARTGVETRVNHSYTHGRDKIIKRLLSYIELHYVVGVIDYEKGISRVYIDKYFDLEKIESGILLGTARGRRNIFAVIFDPNIEEALLCRRHSDICRSFSELEKVKNSKACTSISRILDDEEVKRLIYSIARLLLKKLDIANNDGDTRGGVS